MIENNQILLFSFNIIFKNGVTKQNTTSILIRSLFRLEERTEYLYSFYNTKLIIIVYKIIDILFKY